MILAIIFVVNITDAIYNGMIQVKQGWSGLFHIFKWVSFFTAEGTLAWVYIVVNGKSDRSIAVIAITALVCSVVWRVVYSAVRKFTNN
jgi:hypothetical protein